MQTPEMGPPGEASLDQAIREVLRRPSEPAVQTGQMGIRTHLSGYATYQDFEEIEFSAFADMAHRLP